LGCAGALPGLHTLSRHTHREVTIAYPIKSLPTLPVERAIKVIGGRWKAAILRHLLDRPKRLSELTQLLPNASQKVIIQQLREMEEHGIVYREIFKQVPPRVEYSATKLGLSLEPVITALCEWGYHHAAELNEIDLLEVCVTAPSPRDGQ
jgi:DNA-binding HxlR family transcriptional regulator